MLVKAMLQNGGEFCNMARGCRVDDSKEKYFVPKARIYRTKQLPITNIQEFEFWLNSEDIRVLEVLMTHKNAPYEKESLIITYGYISTQAAQYDTPAVSTFFRRNYAKILV